MSTRRLVHALAASAATVFCRAGLAIAAGTPPSPPKTQEPPTPAIGAPQAAPTAEAAQRARAEAEKLYQEGWAISEQAKADEAAGRTDMAKKKYCKARGRYEVAASIDPKYHQAWNMLGYCARHCGDYKAAFDAYAKALEIAPDFEEAHEYLGELYLETGDLAKAKVQLAWLEARKSDEAKGLGEKVKAAEAKAAAQAKEVKPAPVPETKPEGTEAKPAETPETKTDEAGAK